MDLRIFGKSFFSCTRNDRYWIVERLRFGANGANEAANGAHGAANGAEPGHLFFEFGIKIDKQIRQARKQVASRARETHICLGTSEFGVAEAYKR